MRYYIDCEFDGHNGPLLSIAIVRGVCNGIYIQIPNTATDPWVVANVVPVLNCHQCHPTTAIANEHDVGPLIKAFIADDKNPIIVADSPVDIARFCRAISTGSDGQWESTDYPRMKFEVHNIEAYPTVYEDAVQHNAWWDAMALRIKLEAQRR